MALVFFIIALIYSMVGMGGGSAYIAIMVLFDIPYTEIPLLARLCNLIVVTGTTYYYVRQGHHNSSLSWPFILGALPMAFIGATIPISKHLFLVLVGSFLLLLGFKLLVVDQWKMDHTKSNPIILKWAVLIGAGLGLLSGLTGVGGGIFLVPILHQLKWGTPKQIAASGSIFILINSLAGLMGQAINHIDLSFFDQYWPILLAVLCGGQLGGFIGSSKLPQHAVKKCTAALVLFIGIRLLLSNVSL